MSRTGFDFKGRPLRRDRICLDCRHAKSEHRCPCGPNSIGQWFRSCAVGGRAIGPYWSGGCGCTSTQFSLFRRTDRGGSR